MNKEKIVAQIKQRILDEQRKHSGMGGDIWAELAALKIYGTFIEEKFVSLLAQHTCIYSRTMHQIYPRKCIECGQSEDKINN